MADVSVRGLAEFRRELNKINPALKKELGETNYQAAGVVTDEAERTANALGGIPARVIRRNGLRRSKAANAVSVLLGSNAVPEALGAEYGAKKYRQFEPWRGNQWQPDSGGVGYFLHPAIRSTKNEFVQTYGDMIDALMRRAFPD